MKVNILTLGRSGQSIMTKIIESWGLESPRIIGNTHAKDAPDVEGIRLILIRDFRNWLASAITARVDAYPKGTQIYWKSMVHHISVYDSLLKEIEDGKYWHPNIVILYDKFFQDKEYRMNICEKLGGKYTEEVFDFVPDIGGGSSFDKMRMQGKGSEMKILSRHEQILKTDKAEVYEEMLKENIKVYNKYEQIKPLIDNYNDEDNR